MDTPKNSSMAQASPDRKQPGIVLFYDEYNSVRGILKQDQKGDLLDALMTYGETGDVYQGSDPLVSMAFNIFSEKVRRMAEKYSTRCQRNAENIRRRWEKQKRQDDTIVYDRIPTDTKGYEPGETETQTETQTEAETEAEENRNIIFIPPTAEEVSEYCQERKNGINPEHFVNYYEARGWELKPGQKMKDWKAAVRTWEQNQKGWNNGTNRNHENDRVTGQRELYGL